VDAGGEVVVSAVVGPASWVSCGCDRDGGVSVVLLAVRVGAGMVTSSYSGVKEETRRAWHDVCTSKCTFDVFCAVIRMVMDTVAPGVQIANITHINSCSLAQWNIGHIITYTFNGVEECVVWASNFDCDAAVALDEHCTV